MLTINPRATRISYPDALQSILNIDRALENRAWLSRWNKITPDATPLRALPGLAAQLGLGGLAVKDESVRSDLGSFKALGAPIALIRLVMRTWPGQNFDPGALFAGQYRNQLADFTVISATDGNHGKGLAAAAQALGCPCVIVLHAQVNAEREQAIAAYGAKIVRIAGNYDESVEEAARLAAQHGWHVVSDTSYEGYEDIPRDVMQGYSVIASEAVEQSGSQPEQPAFTHVFLQGGVGGLAAGVASYLWEFHGARRPSFIVVEPEQADCLYQSALAGRAARATGSIDSVMAGLACGEASPLAWRFLQISIDGFLTICDGDAIQAMRVLAEGKDSDPPIVAGESGAAGLAGLLVLMKNPDLARTAGLDHASRVLVINSEGATAPQAYEQWVGEPAESVLGRQAKKLGI